MSDLNLNAAVSDTAGAAPEVMELKKLCTELQAQTNTLRMVLLLVVGALFLFFWREAGYNGFAAAQMQPQVMQASQVAEMLAKQDSSFDKQMQIIRGVAARLAEYGKTHPDYVPILTKYGIPVANTAGPAAAKPATIPTAAPKK